MPNNARGKSLIERKLQDPEYRQRHEETYEAFKLEAQILYALEKKGWSYSDLARATHTQKSNVSRDLKAGGILSASFSRIAKIAEALGMRLVALLVPRESERFVLPEIEQLVRRSVSSTCVEVKLTASPGLAVNLSQGMVSSAGTDFTASPSLVFAGG